MREYSIQIWIYVGQSGLRNFKGRRQERDEELVDKFERGENGMKTIESQLIRCQGGTGCIRYSGLSEYSVFDIAELMSKNGKRCFVAEQVTKEAYS